MRILITGGTGFIGSRAALQCLARGHDVRVLGQENTAAEIANRRLLEERGAEICLGSVAEAKTVERVTEGVQGVIHLAATQHEMDVPDEHFRRVNVEGTRLVLEASASAGVDRFAHGSTIGVYGSPRGVIDENSPCEPQDIYGRTKLEGEGVARSYGDRLNVTIVRIPEVYGPGDRRLLKLFRAIDRGAFFMVGDGSNFHHPMYVDDLVLGLLMVLDSDRAPGELYLFAGKEHVSTADMVRTIATALDRHPPRIRLPLAPFLLAAVIMEFSLRPLGIQPPLHRRRLDFFRKSFRLSDRKAREQLGLVPETDLAEGFRRTAEWYRSTGLLPAR